MPCSLVSLSFSSYLWTARLANAEIKKDNLNLPHVPHMTTIMATINPTARLVRWRREHPERYPFRLSDSSPRPLSFDSETSCIRTKKTWVIEHTLYASSRSEGTRPISTIDDPAEFHKLQWKDDFGRGGKLVEKREITTPSSPVSLDTKMDFPQDLQEFRTASPVQKHRRWKSMFSFKEGTCPASTQPKTREGSEPGPKRKSRFSNMLAGFDTMLSLQAALELLQETMPMPHNCEIPNAVFARKHALVAEDQPIPPTVAIGFMETAESKAVDILSRTMSPWTRFRGPFTPQLGFDGGLDHRELYTVSVHPSRPRGLFADRPLFGEMKKALGDTGSSTSRPMERAGVAMHGSEDDPAMLRVSSRFQPADWREGGDISTAHFCRRRFSGRPRREELAMGPGTG